MTELIKCVVETFAEKPDKIEYDITERGNTVNVKITLDPEDMG